MINKEMTCPLIYISTSDEPNVNTKKTEKKIKSEVSRTWKVRTKIVPVLIGALKKTKKGSVSPRLPVDHSATEYHTTQHCTQHSVSAGKNRLDLLSSGLTRRPPANN
jgi:hypothetical protein